MTFRAITATGLRSPIYSHRHEVERWASEQVLNGAGAVKVYVRRRDADRAEAELIGRFERVRPAELAEWKIGFLCAR